MLPFVLNRGGTQEQVVDLDSFPAPDLTLAALALPSEYGSTLKDYGDDLSHVLTRIKAREALPTNFYVPDLWHLRPFLATGDAHEMWSACSLGAQIAREFYRSAWPLRGATEGVLHSDPKEL